MLYQLLIKPSTKYSLFSCREILGKNGESKSGLIINTLLIFSQVYIFLEVEYHAVYNIHYQRECLAGFL